MVKASWQRPGLLTPLFWEFPCYANGTERGSILEFPTSLFLHFAFDHKAQLKGLQTLRVHGRAYRLHPATFGWSCSCNAEALTFLTEQSSCAHPMMCTQPPMLKLLPGSENWCRVGRRSRVSTSSFQPGAARTCCTCSCLQPTGAPLVVSSQTSRRDPGCWVFRNIGGGVQYLFLFP